jgi:hypothetical protein
MPDRDVELDALVARIREHDAVDDAWIAKSFTDRLLVVDVHQQATLPDDLQALLADHDLHGANEVYGTAAADRSQVGGVGDATRHHFVDVRTRGDHQSYVVE